MDYRTFVDILADRLGENTEHIMQLTNSLAEIVGESGSQFDSIAISNFGVFEPRKRLERVAMHPASGKRLLVPPKIVLGFKPSAALKELVAGDKSETTQSTSYDNE